MMKSRPLVEMALWRVETIPTQKFYYHATAGVLLILMFLCFTLAESLRK